jgi:hypothetical protein
MAINHSAGLIGTASFLLWCGIAGYAVWRYRLRAWPIAIGAPFALATFVGVAYFVIVSLIVPH